VSSNSAPPDGRRQSLSFFFEDEDQAFAQSLREPAGKTWSMLEDHWGVRPPERCALHVMTSWRSFVFGAAPIVWRPLLALTYPLWSRRAASVWEFAGGWALSFGSLRTVGVKPPRLYPDVENSPGRRLFVDVPDLDLKAQHVAIHELTHAGTDHLRLPHWLKEGLAMLAVDRVTGTRTVRDDSLELLEGAGDDELLGPRSLAGLGVEGLIALYARGYWLTRYLDEREPALLRELLATRRHGDETAQLVSASLGGAPNAWPEIVERHFGGD